VPIQGEKDGDLKSPLQRRRAERFLSTQADRFAGTNREEKTLACSVRNDGLWGEEGKQGRGLIPSVPN